MKMLQLISGFVFLFGLGFLFIKIGLHKDGNKEKMIKIMSHPPARNYGKFYILILGVLSFGAAIYFLILLLFRWL
jgi:hypothetical protein